MRTSSIKSVLSALAIALTLAVAVPSADAKPTRSTRMGRGEAIVRAAISLLKRLGGITTNAGPSVPLGDPTAEETVTAAPAVGESDKQQ